MVTIRAATEQDLKTVLMIEAKSFPDPWKEPAFRSYLQIFPTLFLVAIEEGNVIGYAIASLHEDQKHSLLGHLDSIAVTQLYRRRGIGRELMKHILKAFEEKECREALLVVRVSNHEAQQLYQSYGFQVKSHLIGFYGREDGLVMVKKLGREL